MRWGFNPPTERGPPLDIGCWIVCVSHTLNFNDDDDDYDGGSGDDGDGGG